MAVLVEAITLVVRRTFLDVCYPGASEGYIAAHTPDGERIHLAVADESLVAVSTLNRDVAHALGEHLLSHSAVIVDNQANEFVDFAYVDQLEGVAMPCPWLEWTRDGNGVASVRFAPSGSTGVVTPPDWTVDSSTSLTRTDIRLETDHMLKLAEVGGIEYWLDFDTGRQIAGCVGPGDGNRQPGPAR